MHYRWNVVQTWKCFLFLQGIKRQWERMKTIANEVDKSIHSLRDEKTGNDDGIRYQTHSKSKRTQRLNLPIQTLNFDLFPESIHRSKEKRKPNRWFDTLWPMRDEFSFEHHQWFVLLSSVLWVSRLAKVSFPFVHLNLFNSIVFYNWKNSSGKNDFLGILNTFSLMSWPETSN